MQPPVARSVFSTLPCLATALALAAAMLAPLAASAVVIDWVTVGAPGNAADTRYMNCGPSSDSPCGAVAYPYNIGKYVVTNAQYAEFLNKVAATDTNALYTTTMGSNATFGGITRSGSPGSFSYAVKSGFASKPVTFVSFWDAARFANWLHNGQPTGLQTSLTTEDGAYTLTPAAIAANSVLRNPAARVFLPSENEWYKAAYYDPIARLYYDYPTGTNATIGCVPPGADTGNSANCWPATAPHGALTDVGAYTLSHSPSGTFDQGGNVFEWFEQIKYGSSRGMRGGAWTDAPSLLAADNPNIDGSPDDNTGYGFRVAELPEKSMACKADLNGDLVVNFADLAVLKSVFFQRCNDPGPTCGDGIAEAPEQCDDGNLVNGDGCSATCTIEPPLHVLPATGQTTCWNSEGSVIPCAGTGQDGDLKKGVALAYHDNGDGTITDTNTGLMWEKLDDNNAGGIHDWNNAYTWADAFAVKIAALNAGSGFAGHTDWRLPNKKELESIVNLEIPYPGPTVSAAFNTRCTQGCNLTSCSCTQSDYNSYHYWSSSSYARTPFTAWGVHFFFGEVSALTKTHFGYVRAVRGGP